MVAKSLLSNIYMVRKDAETSENESFSKICILHSNVCPAEKRTKRSSNILLRLVRFSAGQTLNENTNALLEKSSSQYA